MTSLAWGYTKSCISYLSQGTPVTQALSRLLTSLGDVPDQSGMKFEEIKEFYSTHHPPRLAVWGEDLSVIVVVSRDALYLVVCPRTNQVEQQIVGLYRGVEAGQTLPDKTCLVLKVDLTKAHAAAKPAYFRRPIFHPVADTEVTVCPFSPGDITALVASLIQTLDTGSPHIASQAIDRVAADVPTEY